MAFSGLTHKHGTQWYWKDNFIMDNNAMKMCIHTFHGSLVLCVLLGSLCLLSWRRQSLRLWWDPLPGWSKTVGLLCGKLAPYCRCNDWYIHIIRISSYHWYPLTDSLIILPCQSQPLFYTHYPQAVASMYFQCWKTTKCLPCENMTQWLRTFCDLNQDQKTNCFRTSMGMYYLHEIK